jgi:hypothetical protein
VGGGDEKKWCAPEKKGVEIGRNGKVAMTPISTRKKKPCKNHIKIIHFVVFIFINTIGLFAQVNNPNGYNKFYYDNGALSSEGTMKDGKPEGYWKNYHKILN